MRRAITILITAWWLAWTCLIVPAHTRGAIALDGKSAKGISLLFSSLPPCCARRAPTDSKSPTPEPANCALCKIIGTTCNTTTPIYPVCSSPAPPQLNSPLIAQLKRARFLPTFQGRAPPASTPV